MIYGHFFKLDRDSQLSKGQAIFRYLPVKCESDKGRDEYPYYPVYAVLNRYAIDFYYHAKDQAKEHQAKDSENDRHVHIGLLHLPLSLNLNVKDNLTSILQNDIYNGTYKISPQYEIVLLEDNDIKTYWNLKVFSLEETKDNGIYFRKLLLDFIYDLEHTHVFENSPVYEEVEVHLRENFMFNAIASKAAYYWDRHNWTQSKNKESHEVNTGSHPENEKNSKDAVNGNIYAENLAASEKQWLKILRSEPSCEYCSYSGGWFESVEKEYKEVIFSESKYKNYLRQKISSVNFLTKDKHKVKQEIVSVPTFDRHKWRKILEKESSGKNLSQNKYGSDNSYIIRESVCWFLRRYNFRDALRVLMAFSKWRPMVFCFVEFCLLVVLPFALGIYPKDSILKYVLLYINCIILLLFLLLPALFIGKLALPIFGMLMPRLIMAISSAWIVFTTTEELYKSSFDVTFSTVWWLSLLIIPVILFMMLEIHNIAPDVKLFRLSYRCLVVLVIASLYSLFIGMFFINFTAKRILTRSGYLPTYYYELDNKKWENPYSDKKRNLNKDENGELEIKEDDSAKLYDNLAKVSPKSNKACPLLIRMKIFSFHLDLLPRMLIFGAIFALFIGIFIQLIFEEKPLTEPL